MKQFPVLKNIGKEPLYWGLSLYSMFIVLFEIILSVIFARGIIAIFVFVVIIASSYFILLGLQSKYGNDFFTKFLKYYLLDFKSTKVNLSELKNLIKK